MSLMGEFLESLAPLTDLGSMSTNVVPDPRSAPLDLDASEGTVLDQTAWQNGAGPESLVPGSRIGQYEIIRRLGCGGTGIVFLARDRQLGRRVAIKIFQTESPDATQRFIAEARATAQCSHENIVVLYEVGEVNGRPFLVFEYLEGQTLASVIRQDAPIPAGRAVDLSIHIIRALACAHKQGIVHRDLKPQNVLLTAAGGIKVLDFGLAKQLLRNRIQCDLQSEPNHPIPMGQSGRVGTLAYMSPEQWGVGGAIDHRSDLWAAGLILYQMLAGCHPLERFGSETATWVAQLDAPVPCLRDIAPAVPKGLAAVVDRCLRKRKEERVTDATALLRALEPFLPGRTRMERMHIEKGPYAGLRPFREEDSGCFFGREREIGTVLVRLRDWPILAVAGPSGIGKSSFVRAGVIPALKYSGENWETLILRPGRDPLVSIARTLTRLGIGAIKVGNEADVSIQLGARMEAEPGYLGSVLRSRARRSGRRLLLFVDQFEELYTLCADALVRKAFTYCLAAAADDPTSPVRVVVSIRSDFLGRASEDARFINELSKGLFFLGPLSPEGMRDSVVHPAELVGYRFESTTTVDEMLQYLESAPGALPLLQFTALQLWEARDASLKLLTDQSYRALGGVAGALVRHADRVINNLTPEARRTCRSLLLSLITEERTRAIRDLDELLELTKDKSEIEHIVQHLVESRLLVVQTGNGVTTVEIIHESLIASWPSLRRWLDENHEDSVLLEQLRLAARQWHAKGRDRGLLWGGDAVEELRRFRRRYRMALPETVDAFVLAVLEQRTRSARRKSALVVAGGIFLALLLVCAAVALVLIQRNALSAKLAREVAERRLDEVQKKEFERKREEVARREAEQDARVAYSELATALERAESERAEAQWNARRAHDAEERARTAAAELQRQLEKERKRTKGAMRQLGGPVAETLR